MRGGKCRMKSFLLSCPGGSAQSWNGGGIGEEDGDLREAFVRRQTAHIHFKVIGFSGMDRSLPAEDRRGWRVASDIAPTLRIGIAPAHDLLDAAVDADDQRTEWSERSRAALENAERGRIILVHAEIGDDVETGS